ncbi:MAG: DUF1553 domain-containing protein [Phycisphaerae bacterium]|nr:DUF1553 domain-containing protein [Phycisphaerae bacterium]
MARTPLHPLVFVFCLAGIAAAQPAPPAGDHPIDKLVFARLDKLGVRPAELCSDAVFIRRACIDVIGTLPTEPEVRAFLADRKPDKRTALIDQLLARDEFAVRWGLKWGDLLRIKAEFPINLWPNAAQGYSRWVRTAVRTNMPYDRFARELLTGTGSNFRVPQANFYRAVQSRSPQSLAQAVALTFMGVWADKWPKDRLEGMAGFFSQVGYKYTGEWKEEIVFWDPAKPATAAVFPDGAKAKLPADRDPREAFADWLIDAKNPWFARNIVNRQWYWLLGRGIIHEPDDIRPDNPASNPELLALLERELVASKYDLKAVFRLILTSRTYQLSSGVASSKPEAVANFASYPLRQMDAEMLIDAICQITGVPENYSSAIPEPFTIVPPSERALSLPDGSIGSSFLEMFGRPARDTGLESERNNAATAAQRLHMLNSSHIQRKLEQSRRLGGLARLRGGQREVVSSVYLTILSRFPTEQEFEAASALSKSAGREAVVDLAWVLMNSSEFLYRH